MENIRILGIGAVVFGFFAAAILCSEGIVFSKEARRKQRAAKSASSQPLWVFILRNGLAPFTNVARAVLKSQTVRKELVRAMQQEPQLAAVQAQPEALMSLILAWLALCLVAGCLFGQSPFIGLCLFACSLLVVSMMQHRKHECASEELREAIPEALQTTKTCFFAGYSLLQTFEQLVKETRGPLKNLFQKALDVLKTGGTFDEALDCIKTSSNEPELVFLSAALEIQHKTGSSIEQVLDACRQTLSDEIELKRSLKTQTAQAKLSAQIVTLMPFVLIVLFSFISEGFLAPFFESPAGIALLIVALSMQVAGVVLVRKLLKVEVV